MKYGKRLNIRLQFYIEYKAKLERLPVVYVNPKGTSGLQTGAGTDSYKL